MSELVKTGAFIGAAVVFAVAGGVVEPERRTAAVLSDQGTVFYEQFNDPQAVKTIEVIGYDEATASARPFQVEFRKGRWVLPSHHDYPVEIGDRLLKTAGALIDLKRDTVVSEAVSEYGRYGVIDPLDAKNPSLQGRGKRVTLRDIRKDVLAEFILGKPVEGKPGMRYVRTPSDKRVYAVKTDADPSANFADWVKADLLRIATPNIRRVSILSYSIDETFGQLMNMESIVLLRENNDWKLQTNEAFQKGPVNAMAATLDTLKIVDVRPKPPSMAAGLRSGQLEMTLEGVTSMRQRGFFLAPTGRLLANEGEMMVETQNGVAYTLRFGEVASGEDRYLFVTAGYDAARAAKYGDATGGGESAAKELTNRFADWYYVIRGADFQKLRLKRRDIGLAAPPPPMMMPTRPPEGERRITLPGQEPQR
ncbi:MAG: DUF4340 domain-containing protein [Bryobacteraceae bacterium]|nr:DUF4340 domain-containing protein [Bryobacteraceae bacterium]